MVFSSVVFLFFFLPVTLAVALALQPRVNRVDGRGLSLQLSDAWLLLASLVFYAWGELRLVWVLILSGVLSYCGGLLVGRLRGRARSVALAGFVATMLAMLGWFKYATLAVDLFDRLNAVIGHPLGDHLAWRGVALPLGISFFTFHGISYVVDVYRGHVRPSRRPLEFACYFTLFPQLVAGPIVRFSEVAKYFVRRRTTWDDLAEGVQRFIGGLGKKVLIANQVALLADAAFALPEADRNTGVAWLGTAAYALQIYFDFSGYSDMALGLGRIFGFTFPENFNHPYTASSIREFWRRWHMTLSRFFRDYVYIPLGGNRHGALRTSVNLLTVFALCGLWHGAAWTFLAWGLFHGFFLAAERLWSPVRVPRGPVVRVAAHLYTLVVVLFGWVLFRSESWRQAASFWQAMLGLGPSSGLEVLPWRALAPDVVLAFGAGVILSFPVGTWLRHNAGLVNARVVVPPVRVMASLAIFALCLLAIAAGSHNPFIYYRF